MPSTDSLEPFLESRHLDLAREADAFARGELAELPIPADDAAAREAAREILGRLGDAGLLAYAVPQDGAVDRRACCLIREAFAAVSPLADEVFALQCLGTQPMLIAGEAERRSDWLHAARRGRAMTAFAMTEPDAGSDASAVSTRAVFEEGGWRLDGDKHLISNAGVADVYLVLAVTEADRQPPGLSWFVVSDGTAGLEFVGAQVLSEPHPLGALRLRNCRLPEEALLGELHGGFALGMRTLDRLRPTVAAAACGMATRALAEAVAHARTRTQFGRALSGQPIVRQKLAVMATELDAARLLTYRAAWAGDTGAADGTKLSSMAKWYATEAAQRVVDQAVQIHGGIGVLRDSPVDRLYRSVRALRIYEGATEIQQIVVAREILRQSDP